MDKLWAPWRINYIRNKKQKGCLFCGGSARKRKDYIIFKTAHAIALLNIFPYNNGHMMVSPLRHVAGIDQLKDEEALDLFRAIKRAQKLLDKVVKPQGYNIGLNMGRAAGAGITGHLHIHIVPRWLGDSNFMPAMFDTKIISQSLDELYKELKNALSKTA
ncbi:MAG: HIT domain-containing protein [Candidatus Omnitrophota bacterium]|nr:HIT domain-containing protein [Candidatus Omnitrophota bacterium]